MDSYVHAWQGDPTGCPPGERVLGAYHANKNSIAGLVRGHILEYPMLEDDLHDWCKLVKPSMRAYVTLRHPPPPVMRFHHVSRTVCEIPTAES